MGFISDVPGMICSVHSSYPHIGDTRRFWVPAHGFLVDIRLKMMAVLHFAPRALNGKLPSVISSRLPKQSTIERVAYKQKQLISLQSWRLRNPSSRCWWIQYSVTVHSLLGVMVPSCYVPTGERKSSSSRPVLKTLIPFVKTLTSDFITSQRPYLIIPSHWWLGFQFSKFRGMHLDSTRWIWSVRDGQ